MLNKIRYWWLNTRITYYHLASAWCNKRAEASLRVSNKFIAAARKAIDKLDKIEEGLE